MIPFFEKFTNQKRLAGLLKENATLWKDISDLEKAKTILENRVSELEHLNADQLSKIEELRKNASIQFTEEESSIAFAISKDLSIKIQTRANRELGETLVKENYLDETALEDEGAYHLALLVIANEVTDQMILEYSGELSREDDVTSRQDSDTEN